MDARDRPAIASVPFKMIKDPWSEAELQGSRPRDPVLVSLDSPEQPGHHHHHQAYEQWTIRSLLSALLITHDAEQRPCVSVT